MPYYGNPLMPFTSLAPVCCFVGSYSPREKRFTATLHDA
jgi:hypothetical protein